MLASTRASEPKLQAAHRALNGVQRDLAESLFAICKASFHDEKLVGQVFRAVEAAWESTVEVERHMLRSFAGRAFASSDVAAFLRALGG